MMPSEGTITAGAFLVALALVEALRAVAGAL